MARKSDNIAGVEDPGVLLTQKGSMIGASGPGTPVEIPPGADGEALVYDSTAPSGVTARAIDPASINTTNATNATLFQQGM